MRSEILLAASALCALAACSQGASTSSSATPAAKVATAVIQGNVCDRKLLTLTDVAGILDQTVTGTKPLQGDPQTCYFISANNDRGGPELRITLRPGHGKATLDSFTSGKMNAYATWKPLAGIGDEAVWLPDLHEIDARKANTLCVVGAPLFLSKALRDAGEVAQQQRLGALCNKVFAAL
ncbi:MAG: hypothetical protein JSS13_12960 [Proteobacteria bacterium]|nr:hypothetical protein [Pseudomonadota bacterium]